MSGFSVLSGGAAIIANRAKRKQPLAGKRERFHKSSWLHLNIGYPAVGGSSLNPISSPENSGGVQRIAKSAVKEGRNSIRWEWYPKIIQ
jgi:hypothetical protein